MPRIFCGAPWWAGISFLVVTAAFADPPLHGGERMVLTCDAARGLAAERAPGVARALADLEQRRAEGVGAGSWARANPTVNAQGGVRVDPTVYPDLSVGVAVPIPLYFDRAARLRAASAAVDAADVAVEEARWRAEREGTRAYLAALHARDRREVLEDQRALAVRLAETAKARFDVGDVSAFDVAQADLELAVAEAKAADAAREEVHALGALALLVGLHPEGFALAGDLDEETRAPALDDDKTGDLAPAAAAEAAGSAADRRADATAWRFVPRPSLGAGYTYEEGGHVGRGTLSVELPLFAHGQEERASARAEARRRRAEAAILRDTLAADAARLRAERERSLVTLSKLRDEAAPAAERLRTLGEKSHAAGKLALGDLLELQRAELSVRLSVVDEALRAALLTHDALFLDGARRPSTLDPHPVGAARP